MPLVSLIAKGALECHSGTHIQDAPIQRLDKVLRRAKPKLFACIKPRLKFQ